MNYAPTADELRQAKSAAADAAADARSEALARSGLGKKDGKAAGRKRRLVGSRSKGEWQKFVVDIWLTDLNPTEFGVYKRSRNRARSRQFTQDMDIYAEVLEEGKRTALIGYRQDLWKKKEGMSRRLVIKMFTDSLGWRGTMDLLIGRSLQLTVGARGLPVMAYSINTDDDDYLIYIERSANKWQLLPENFSFFLMNNGELEFYRLRRALINIRGDYKLYDEHDNVIGYLDGRLLSLAGKWYGGVRSEFASKKLMTVLKLFASTIVFNGPCRRHIRQLWREVRDGKLEPKLEHQESDLYMNPRRVR
ncbi:MAG: hypothetical protein RLZ98_2459 [Pseudomonadota bacterium]|jgi:hypothetical protein